LKKQKKSLITEIKHSVYFMTIFFAVAFTLSQIVPSILIAYSLVTLSSIDFVSYVTISLAFPLSAMLYLSVVEKGKGSIADKLGLGKKSLTLGNIGIGILLFLIILALEVGVDLISSVTGVQINTNVGALFEGAPFWFFVFAAIIVPIDEEILFRGLLVPKTGMVFSALIFAALHYTYNSTYGIEMIAALAFGLIAGYSYKKTGSLYPSIAAHMLVNALTVVATLQLLI